MMARVAEGLSVCMRTGVFPQQWKIAKLILIPKGDQQQQQRQQDGEIPKARPICLLDEIGKIFERVIAERIKRWMRDHPEAELSNGQFGFREGRSTCDALTKVQSTINDSTNEGGVAIAISLDIKNAFNSLPWTTIREVLESNGYPRYLRRIIDSYLHERLVKYPVEGGTTRTKAMTAGVPQGSVLGPLLWNVAYNSVLEVRREEGCSITCYADDTLIVAVAHDTRDAINSANLQTSVVVRKIKQLGLTVSASKTEAVLFTDRKRNEGPVVITIDGVPIRTKEHMKYLGVILDSHLNFREHFKYMEGKAVKIMRALGRLMPNLRGPGEAKRRLYANVLMSVLTYGAPIWSDALASSWRAQVPLRRLQRTMAIRVISAYRSVSYDAATLLARMPPLFVVAAARKRTYVRITDLKNADEWTAAGEKDIRVMENIIMIRQWSTYLSRPGAPGARTRDAFLPVINDWMTRKHGSIAFRLTQLLTGHGCFNTYLYRINKTDSPICAHCEVVEDSAEHTWQQCTAWEEERRILYDTIGLDLSMLSIARAITRNQEAWAAVTSFAETVIRAKEEAERSRQQAARRDSSGVSSNGEGA